MKRIKKNLNASEGASYNHCWLIANIQRNSLYINRFIICTSLYRSLGSNTEETISGMFERKCAWFLFRNPGFFLSLVRFHYKYIVFKLRPVNLFSLWRVVYREPPFVSLYGVPVSFWGWCTCVTRLVSGSISINTRLPAHAPM